jgi:hypothetical protein
MSNPSYNSNIPYNYGLLFKEAIYYNLYTRQVDYWNKRLQEVSIKNVACYVREDPDFNTGDSRTFVGIWYDGESFTLLTPDNDDDWNSPYCLEAYEEDKELLDEIKCLCSQLRKLEEERYLAERFLASLTMFEPPPKILKKILGDGLYRICHNAFSNPGLDVDISNLDWQVSEPEALKTFVNEQQSTIKAMQDRVMLNMITL